MFGKGRMLGLIRSFFFFFFEINCTGQEYFRASPSFIWSGISLLVFIFMVDYYYKQVP